MIPRLGEPVVPGVNYKERVGAYAILPRDDLVLITHQAEPLPEFQLPGGAVDCGETLLAALHREVLEETGWRIRVDRMLCSYMRYTYLPEYEFWARKVCHVFLALPVRKVGPPEEKFHSAHWAPAELAVELFDSPGDKAVLRTFGSIGNAKYFSVCERNRRKPVARRRRR
ncbi:MAG: NUDIX hydrolase [Albidovulum sp.]|nr:NUDIX hydrolase [Albidovulum sp.]MDE0306087.1 NUDIX hydrolase [Albidovulum sp.]MDE0531796.1 NUDIX hydrolase [Albidovulum sp.]